MIPIGKFKSSLKHSFVQPWDSLLNYSSYKCLWSPQHKNLLCCFWVIVFQLLSRVWLFATLWTVAHQAPLSMGFPGKNTGMGRHFLLQGPANQPMSPALAGRLSNAEPPGKPEWSSKAIQLMKSSHILSLPTFERMMLFTWPLSSVAQSCPTLCDPTNRSTPGLPVHHQLLEFTQTHVHRVCDAIQPSHPLSSPSPPAPNPSQHQGLFQWVISSHKVAKVLEFQL